ncbi:hypothetical protein E0W00_12425 [Salmonella enterica subsp. enterica serovar Llandoff]|nr:hypothetical protein [Salmonella enterica subsp. enterica serovar Llandoff]ECO4188313.1 hypothetical protein [Salmonella enterica]
MTIKETPRRHGIYHGVEVGRKDTIFTLSIEASCSSEAIAELKAAIRELENGQSHFAEGENNVMLIGEVKATSRFKFPRR